MERDALQALLDAWKRHPGESLSTQDVVTLNACCDWYADRWRTGETRERSSLAAEAPCLVQLPPPPDIEPRPWYDDEDVRTLLTLLPAA